MKGGKARGADRAALQRVQNDAVPRPLNRRQRRALARAAQKIRTQQRRST